MPPQSSLRDFSIEDSESLQVGEVFGGYQVLCCLNYTILGGLYHVKQEDGDAEYCLGVIPTRCSENEEFRKRFEDRVSKIIALNHPNILKLLRWEEVAGRLCLIYEAFDSENLNDAIEKRILKQIEDQDVVDEEADSDSEPEEPSSGKPKLKLKSGSPQKGPKPGASTQQEKKAKEPLFEENYVKQLGLQALAALQAAHQQKIYHWGLTPSQWLVDAQGNIKIAGLGLQSMMGKDLFESLVSQAVIPIKTGKKRFFISEMDVFSQQRNKSEALDHREDFYSLGICIYSMLTGIRMHPKQAYHPVLSELPGASTGWDVFIQKCLQPQVGQRYHSAEAASRDLNELDKLVERGAQAVIEDEVEQKKATTQPSKAKGLLVAAIVVILLCAGGAAVFFGLMGNGQPPAPHELYVGLPKQGEQANVHLILTPQSTVTFAGKPQPFASETGDLALLMDKGTYSLRVSATDYKTKDVKLVVGEQPVKQRIVLEPDFGVFELSSLSLVVVVLKDSENKIVYEGTTDREGRVTISEKLWKNRPYSVSLKKEGYQDLSIEGVTIPSDGILKEFYKLAFSPGSIKVSSKPEGATLFVNGEEAGKTPLSVADLPVKKEIKLEAKLDSYYPVQKMILLSPGENLSVDFGELKGRFGQAELKIYWDEGPLQREHAQDMTVQLNDEEPKPLTSLKFEDLLEGKHSIIVRHPDCKASGVRFMVKEKEVTSIAIKMRPYPAILNITTTPQVSFNLFADGLLQRPKEGSLYLLRAAQARVLELRAPGYFPVKNIMTLKAKEEHEWNLELKKVPPPELGKNYVAPDYSLELTWMSPGRFTMGSPRAEKQRLPEEGPLTDVTLTYGFWIGTYEVTQAQYQQIMGNNPSKIKGEKHPVESITHTEAMQFCQKLTSAEAKLGRLPKGYVYRLPTEAEWEYSARGGKGEAFSFGSRAVLDQGNFRGTYPDFNRENPNKKRPQTTPVGSFPPNPYGLFDMHGNVSEWGLEAYRARLPGKSVQDPVGPLNGREYVVRGGNYKEWADRARSAARMSFFPEARMSNVGMRVVLAPQKGS